ncbi:MAG TPA: cobalamin-binding protein [Steroidobacteraceae bacterium]|nr:cobalamin-binding protein [Steroidobacteraceae bacterium]
MGRIIRGLPLALLIAASRIDAAGLDVVDDTGVHLLLAQPARRIIALAPGAAEMLFAAGAGSHLIATVSYADEPDAARRVPRIGDSNAIDLERLLGMKPDVVVYWPGGNNPAQIAGLRRLGFTLYAQQVNRLDDIGASLRRLGLMAGTGPAAEARADDIERQLAQLRERYAKRTPVSAMLQTWNQPLYTVGGGQLMSDALATCGAVNVFGDLPRLSSAVQVEAVLRRDPQLLIAAAPPGAGQEWLRAWRRFPSLRAVRTGNLFAFEDQALSRLGPSVVEATAGLCARIDAARTKLSRENY